jgi:hypothetical protein
MLHGFVVLHVGVDEGTRKVLDVFADSFVINICLMISKRQVVNRGIGQSFHHTMTSIDSGEKVWGEKVTCQDGDDLAISRLVSCLLYHCF